MVASNIPVAAAPAHPASTAASPPAAPAPAADAKKTADDNDKGGDFVSMMTQLLGNADAATPTTIAATIKGALAKDSDGDNATEDALSGLLSSSLLANAATPMITQVVAQVTAQANSQGAAAAVGGASSPGAMTARMLSDGAQEIARSVQLVVQQPLAATLDSATDASTNGKDAQDANAQDNSANAANVGGVLNANNLIDNSPVDMQLKERVGTSAWRDEVGAKLNWMIDRGVQSGSLRLSPEHLGPLEVRISVHDGQASVWFGAAHADTRAALEQALPRLRELFSGSGLSLADAGVFREPPKENYKNNSESYIAGRSGRADIETGVASIVTQNGLFDAYA